MKRRLFLTLLIGLTVFAQPVYASHFWQVKISTPKPLINSRSFNVEYTTLSVEADDDFTVTLFQNGSSFASQPITEDFGDSGAFAVTVPADGSYEYKVAASTGAESKETATQTVTVDTLAPGAPVYQGVVRDGNSYALTFTAPSNGDVTEVRIYSSSATSFTANPSTQVGTIAVNPDETKVFVYTAPDSAQRFHAVQAFDAAGNFSTLVGDPGITVVQGQVSGVGGTGAGTGVSGAGAAGQVGQVGGTGEQTTGDQPTEDQDGEVLGEEDGGIDWWWWLLLAGLVVALWFLLRRRGDETTKTSSKK